MDILGHGGTVPSFRSRFLGKVEQGGENENFKNTKKKTKQGGQGERECVCYAGASILSLGCA